MSAHDSQAVRRHMDRLAADGIDVVRVTYPDLIGTDRARDVLLEELPRACEHGLAFCRAVYHTSPQGDVVPVSGTSVSRSGRTQMSGSPASSPPLTGTTSPCGLVW